MIREILHRMTHAVAVAAIAGLAAFSSPAFARNAQDGDRPAQRGDEGQRGEGPRGGAMMRVVESLRTLISDLKLSDEQKGASDAIMQTLREDIRSAVQDPNVNARERFQKVRATIEESQTRLREILNDEQKATFDAGIEKIRAELRAAATQPGRGAEAGGRGMQMTGRIQRALGTLDLSDEQKGKLQPIVDDAAKKLAAIRDEGGDAQAIRAKAMELRDEVVGKISEILTDEQKAKFREAMQAERPGGGRPRDGATMTDSPPEDGMMTGNSSVRTEAGTSGLAASPARPSATATASSIVAIAPGDAVPAFSLLRLDGTPFSNASLAGKPAVLLFGSHSSPALRDRIAALQTLAEKTRNRAAFILIYTAEMYPSQSEQPTRNVNDKISVAAHKTPDDRAAAARTARDDLKIKLDIAPDRMDASLQHALGVSANGAAVIGADGTLQFRQDWADAFAIERALQDAFAKR